MRQLNREDADCPGLGEATTKPISPGFSHVYRRHSHTALSLLP